MFLDTCLMNHMSWVGTGLAEVAEVAVCAEWVELAGRGPQPGEAGHAFDGVS